MLGNGAELILWLDLRESFVPGNLEPRCFLAPNPDERKSVIDRERLGREESSVAVVGRPRGASFSCGSRGSGFVETMAVMLIGVAGLLMK